MAYTVKKDARDSAYIQLYRQLRQDIVEGVLPTGARLPSKRQLAAEAGVSVITAEHAIGLLVDEGYAVPRERSGVYASFGGSAPLPRARLEEMRVPSAPPEDFPFSVLARVMRRVLSERGPDILVKSPARGCAELRAAISAYLARSRRIKVAPEQIVVGSGAEYLYGLVVKLFGRGGQYAHESPCYEKIRRVYEANGADCVFLPLAEDGIESAALDACRAGLLHVTPYHSFPSGVTASVSKRYEYAAWARARDAFLVEDDYASEFSSAGGQIDTIFSLAPERTIYINTFSKTLAPSMRMGYMVLPGALLALYEERVGFFSCTVPLYEQLVLSEFIEMGELERYINRRRKKLRQAGK